MIGVLWTIVGFAGATVAAVVVGNTLRARRRELAFLADPPVRSCWSCGCTDNRACAGGCGWVSDSLLDADWNLCTACLEWRDAADKLAASTGHPSALPADPRSPGRRVLERLGWTLCAAYLVGALGFAGTLDYVAAGGAR